jgi:hypothetical protein
LLTSACVSFPPQFLDEQKLVAGQLRSSKLLVAINPQVQICKSSPGRICATPASQADFPGYVKLGNMIKQRVEASDVRTVVDVYDADLFSAGDSLAREKPDWVLRMRQERVSFVNGAVAGITWLVTLSQPNFRVTNMAGGAGDNVVYRFRYSTMGTFCIGTRLVEAAQGAADTCLGNQADVIVGRLKANGYLN